MDIGDGKGKVAPVVTDFGVLVQLLDDPFEHCGTDSLRHRSSRLLVALMLVNRRSLTALHAAAGTGS